jgi:hypothetical protein
LLLGRFGPIAPIGFAERVGLIRLLFAGDRQPFSSFRSAALQNEPAILGAHPHQKTMRAFPAARIRLKRTLAFHNRILTLKGTLNVSEAIRRVSIARRVC